jgi:hypothetical protein
MVIKYDIDKFIKILKTYILENNIYDISIINWDFLKLKTETILNNFKNKYEHLNGKEQNKDKIMNIEYENEIYQLTFLWFRFWSREIYENELDVLFTHALIDSFEFPENFKWVGYF